MHKPLHVSWHYNQDSDPKPPISQGNFTTRLRASLHWVFRHDAQNTTDTHENISNYFECTTKAPGSRRLPVSPQSLSCYSGFSLPTQFALQATRCSLTNYNMWSSELCFDIGIKALVLSYRLFHKLSNRVQRCLSPHHDLFFFLAPQLKVPWDACLEVCSLRKAKLYYN